MNDLISVIVPVYNTAPYIEKCVGSLTSQTYENLDIILIDDGSSDNSGDICESLAEKDGRITVIRSENQGVSKARYTALLSAKGKYVTFVDSDDYVDSDYIKCLYSAIREFDADAASSGYRNVFDGGIPDEEQCGFENGNICLTPTATLKMIFYDKIITTAITTKLFKTDMMREIAPSDLALGEDSYICLRYFFKCRRIVHTGKILYSYYQRAGSAVHSYPGERFYDYVRLYDMLLDECQKTCPDAFPAHINKLVENNFVAFLKMYGSEGVSPEKISHIRDNIKKYRKEIIADKKAEKRTRLACLLSYAGMDTVAKVYGAVDKLRG